jgi:hypothetical protein
MIKLKKINFKKSNIKKNPSQFGLTWSTYHPQYEIGIKKLYFIWEPFFDKEIKCWGLKIIIK